MQYLKHILTSAVALLVLSACGGGDSGPKVTTYAGNTAQATINDTKAATYTKATADAMLNKLESGNIPGVIKPSNKMLTAQKQTTSLILQEPVAGICNTGSVDISGSQTDGTIQYMNCVIISTDTITLNGTATYTFTDINNLSINYRNFSIRFNDEAAEVLENMTVTITDGTVTISSDFTGSDGLIYRIAEFEVLGSNPYTITGRIYHPTNGYVDISGTVITSTCGLVERATDGSLTITASNGYAAITFIDCDTFSVDINGTVTTANW